MIRIGYHEADGVDNYSSHTIIDIHLGGIIIFTGDAHIGQGAIFVVKEEGTLTLGLNFAISGTTSIICSKAITFGDDVQLSWNTLILDNDAHKIFDEENRCINQPQEISIGNNVWIAAGCTILKGTKVPSNSIIASNSLVNKRFIENNCIIGGQPARIIKNIRKFEI